MRKILLFLIITVSVSGFSACRDQKATGSVVSTSETQEEKDSPYMEGNKNIMRRENEEMQMFIKRYGWEMQRTPTGLYIQILDPGKGDLFRENDRVAMEYRTFLLSGEQVYCSDSTGLKVFLVNRSEEIDASTKPRKCSAPAPAPDSSSPPTSVMAWPATATAYKDCNPS